MREKKRAKETSSKARRGRAVGRPLLAALLASLAFEGRAADPLPRLSWAGFFARIESTGATFSERMRTLDGKRVVLRGYAVKDPVPPGGLYLTHFPEGRLHPDDEDSLPWDSVGVVWRKGARIPAIPTQPTIEGTLRLGNRELGTETVILVLEDATPHVEKAARAASGGAR